MIDLRALFGERYRIGSDPAALSLADPWMQTIPCKYGVIYPHGPETLALDIDRHPHALKQVLALPRIVIHQNGDHEKTILFPLEMFDAIAAIVQPRKRRRLSEEDRAKLIERGKQFRYAAGAQEIERQDTEKPSEDQCSI